ncbi:MarR family transcriptional regulator [Streptomyces sp. AJS327]|uniref:MarR family winged helix-turn-helix transcriptional regulator n=1 Tax=Streptomyces sp. AJS327 TaxID=2545265 RepID=UPI0015DF8953|nr:MarR family transcriptional regulator [Streptomyces sp. AJS327]MBA0052448.1 MarR family transcriptional regulator [Streptomyces sp. AJS327]
MSGPLPDENTDDLADQLLRLTRRLNLAHRRGLAPVGVTPAQARLLRVLARRPEPPRMADLAGSLGVVPRQVTSLVDALEERGLVRRAPDPGNRRAIRIELTRGGEGTLATLHQARRSAAEELLAPLSGDQRDTLRGLLIQLDQAPDARP